MAVHRAALGTYFAARSAAAFARATSFLAQLTCCERKKQVSYMRFYAVRRYPGYVYYQTEIRDNYEVVSAGTAAPGRRWAGPGRGARAAPASERRARREGSEARGCGGPWSRARDRAL